MFHLQNVTLLQPEALIAPRLPGGAAALGQYLQGVQTALIAYYSSGQSVGPRSLIVAVGPGGRVQFWLSEGESVPIAEQVVVQRISETVPPPIVDQGPVLLALIYSVGPTAIPQERLTLPREWQAVLQRNGGPLPVDGILERLWADAG